MSTAYEVLLILKSLGTETELAQSVKRLEEPIKKLGGQLDKSASWGRRRLAYRIARQTEGHYHLVNFHMAPDQLSELKRLYQLNEAIVRFLILNRSNHQDERDTDPSRPTSQEGRPTSPTPGPGETQVGDSSQARS